MLNHGTRMRAFSAATKMQRCVVRGSSVGYAAPAPLRGTSTNQAVTKAPLLAAAPLLRPTAAPHAHARMATVTAATAATATPHELHRPVSQLAKDLSQQSGPVVLWFKGDLRVDDHEGLAAIAGSSAESLLPVYCLDPEHLVPLLFIPGGPEVLVDSLRELRAQLRARGSDLVVTQGPWGRALPALVGKARAQAVVSEVEVELSVMQPSEEALRQVTSTSSAVQSYTWETHIWGNDKYKGNYREWAKTRGAPSPPKDAPTRLPALPAGWTTADTGSIPTSKELRATLQAALTSLNAGQPEVMGTADAAVAAAVSSPATAALSKILFSTQQPTTWEQRLAAYLGTSYPGTTAGTSASSSSGSGADLRSLMASAVASCETPAAEGASFPALFGTAMALGVLSRRRVYALAAVAGAGSAGAPLPVRAASIAVESADFHEQLAARNDERPPDMPQSVVQQHWRWRNFMTDFCSAAPPPGAPQLGPDAPAILLVHGFGAFGDQWRGNMEELAAAGYHVYAPTFPGFGRSEKVAVPYSQLLWSDFLRDFVVQVVGRPVVMAGNSIGGFISTSMAADYPGLVRGLVLLNSAGPIDASFTEAGWQEAARTKKTPAKWIVSLVSQGLFWYLERTVPGTLKWLYPTRPERADKWLATEIYRAACDPGSIGVFASVFYLPPPRALNWLINERFRHPTLVLQGALDPLNDARGRAAELQELCPKHVTKVLLDAGHCPHDEVPDQVNRHLLDFIKGRVLGHDDVAVQKGAASAAAANGAARTPGS